MAQETVEQSLDERLTVLKELQQKNSLGKWAAKATSAQGGLKPKLIGEPPKRPRQAAKIFSDEKLRLVKQSGSRPAWRANTIPRDVQDDYEGLPEDKKQGWEALAAEERAKYQKDLIAYDLQNPGYSASLGQQKAAASKPAGAKRSSGQRKSTAVAGPAPARKAVDFYIDEKVENRRSKDPLAKKQDIGELRKEIAVKETAVFEDLASPAKQRFEDLAADDHNRYLEELEDFPAAKAAWQARQGRQKGAAGPGKSVKQLAEGEADDPEISGSEDDENAENQPGPSKGKRSAAAAKGGKGGPDAGRGRAVSKSAPAKAAKAQGTIPPKKAEQPKGQKRRAAAKATSTIATNEPVTTDNGQSIDVEDAAAAAAATEADEQPRGQKRGRSAKATQATKPQPSDGPPALDAAQDAADKLPAPAAAQGAAQAEAPTMGPKKRGRPAKAKPTAVTDAVMEAGKDDASTVSTGGLHLAGSRPRRMDPTKAAAGLLQDASDPIPDASSVPNPTETAMSADIDMLDVQPAVCGEAADGAQPISVAPAPSDTATIKSPGRPAARGRAGKRKADALVSEPAEQAAPKRRAGRQAADNAAAPAKTTSAPTAVAPAADADASAAMKDAVVSTEDAEVPAEVPKRRGRGRSAASKPAASAEAQKPAASTAKLPETAEAANGKGAEAAVADEQVATGKGGRRGGKAAALASKGGVAKPVARKGRAARGNHKADKQGPAAVEERAPGSSDAEAAPVQAEAEEGAADDEGLKGVPGVDYVPPTLEKQPGIREEPITSPVALMKAAGLPSGPPPVLPLNIALGSSQDASSQEHNIDAHLPTSQAHRTGKNGRRSSILGGLSNTVLRMWPFKRGAVQAAAATALPEGNEVAEDATIPNAADVPDAAAEGAARVSPRLQQAAERAMQGQQYVGRAVRKSFPDEVTGVWRPFNGTVASFDPADTLWKIAYEDDDSETMEWEELKTFLVPEPAHPVSAHAEEEQPTGQPKPGNATAAADLPQVKAKANKKATRRKQRA